MKRHFNNIMRSIVTKSHAYSNITSLNFSELEEYMNDNVKYVITNSSWDDNFDEALVNNSLLAFVKPTWIYACHKKRSVVPCQPYIVAPF